jgi:twitching motility protein PilI
MKNRTRLLAYQQELAERLRASASAPISTSLLGVQVGDESWLIDLRHAGEILSPPHLVSTPLTRPWLLGMANVRSAFFGIVDFARFCGHGPTPITAQSRVILGASKLGLPFGLLVSRILGLKRPEQLERRSGEADGVPWIVAEYRDVAGQPWTRLDIPGLALHAQFRHAAL